MSEKIDELIDCAKNAAPEMVKIMEQQGIVIDNLEDKMQKFAMTCYSRLVQLTVLADAIVSAQEQGTS